MLNNFRLGNLGIQNMDNTQLEETDEFAARVLELARVHAQGMDSRLRKGMVTEEGIAVVRLNPGHSLIIHVDPKLKNNPHFWNYDNRTGKMSETMDYEDFKDIGSDGNLSYFESRMDKAHMLYMLQMLKPGSLELIHAMIFDLDEEKEEYDFSL